MGRRALAFVEMSTDKLPAGYGVFVLFSFPFEVRVSGFPFTNNLIPYNFFNVITTIAAIIAQFMSNKRLGGGKTGALVQECSRGLSLQVVVCIGDRVCLGWVG